MRADARDGIKTLWQQQAPERTSMTLEQVQAKARQLDERGRKRRIAGYGFTLSRFPNAESVAGGLVMLAQG